MRFIHINVSAWEQQDFRDNIARMDLLANLVDQCIHHEARLLVIPAGFLRVPCEDEMPPLVTQVEQLANDKHVAIIGGVDVASRRLSREEIDNLVRDGSLPSFGFAVGPVAREESGGHPWRQTSCTNENAPLVASANIPRRNRKVTIDGKLVGVLICGELFSEPARNSLARLSCNESWDLILDLGHVSMGQGLFWAMRRLALDAGCPVAHSQHLRTFKGNKIHFVNARGERDSQPTDANGLLRRDGLWVGWSLRTI